MALEHLQVRSKRVGTYDHAWLFDTSPGIVAHKNPVIHQNEKAVIFSAPQARSDSSYRHLNGTLQNTLQHDVTLTKTGGGRKMVHL